MRLSRRTRQVSFYSVLTVISAIGVAMSSGSSPLVPSVEAKERPSDMVVHEWGTFLSMSGSDGTTLDGMYHEEHALPGFVHSRSRDQLRLPIMFLKGETPVIYFYANQRQSVRVGVGFPRGVWTQWYPQAAMVNPSLLEQAQTPEKLRGGRICWFADIIPASQFNCGSGTNCATKPGEAISLPATSSDALWNHAREVDAAYVKINDQTKDKVTSEFERFLFYRGLGDARLPLRLDERQNGTLTVDRDATLGTGVGHVFVLKVEDGRGAYTYRRSVAPGVRAIDVIPSMAEARPLAEFTKDIAGALAAKLTESGLYGKEARAMVNTWTSSYFQTDGVRALFVLPQSWTDAFIPMTISPQPQQIVRVMVGRLELLSAERERLAETAVHNLASDIPDKRQEAFRFLHEQGRYAEPIIRRLLKSTKDDALRSLCRRLLLTEFVTELRAIVHNSADGKRLNTDPTMLRAQLARLLREIGADEQARAEAEAVMGALKKRPVNPNQSLAVDHSALEIRAAAAEAVGDFRKASALYAQRVELQLKMITSIDVNTIAWLRDWWVGHAYARCLLRTPRVDATIADLQRYLGQPPQRVSDIAGERGMRVRLAFLLEGQGKTELAETQWLAIGGKSQLKAVASPPPPRPRDSGPTGT
jgi:hypothetical protein